MPAVVNLVLMMVLVVVPLLLFYGKDGWSKADIRACVIVLPLIMFFISPPLHELSHLAATYLVGGKIEEVRLLPTVSREGLGLAYIRSSGMSSSFQHVATSLAPYLLDLALFPIALLALIRRRHLSPFVAGMLFMGLCLRGLFDISSNILCGIVYRTGDFSQLPSTLGRHKLYLLALLLEGVAFLVAILIVRQGYHRSRPTVVGGTHG